MKATSEDSGREPTQGHSGNLRVGTCYASGAVLSTAAGAALLPWGAILFWPGLACAVVACGYFGAGTRIYRKRHGRLPVLIRLVLAPTLLGQHLSLLHYRRQGRDWDEAAPGVLIGRRLSDREAEAALAAGVTAVLDLTTEFSEARPFLSATYRNLPILDLTAPSPAQLREAVAFIREQSARGVVYVHCKIGYSRTAAVAAAYLIASGRCPGPTEAVAHLRAVRPSVVIRPEAMQAIERFAAR